MHFPPLRFAFPALFSLLVYAANAQQCQYKIVMHDAYGDGWNGGLLTVLSGSTTNLFTLDDDLATATVSFDVTSGAPVVLTWTPGDFDDEISFELYNNDGDLLYKVSYPKAGALYTGTGACVACLKPGNVIVDNVYDTRVKLRWTPATGSSAPAGWRVIYDTAGFAPGPGAGDTLNTALPKVTVTGLQKKTKYDFYVQQDCGNGETGTLAGPFTVETYWTNDVGITGVLNPQNSCDLGVERVTIVMKNSGANPQTLIPFNYSVNGKPSGVPQPQDGFYTGVLGKDSSKVIAGVNQSGLGLPNRDYYTKTDEKSVKTREEYVKHVAKMLELIGEDPASTTEKAKAILAIETKLAEKSMTPVQLRDPNAVYHLMTQEEFQKLTPSIKWKNFFQVVNPPKFLQVNVAQPEFMKAVNGFMTDISINDWKTYLQWHLVDSTAGYLSAKFVDQNFEFNNKYLSGAKEQQPRWIKVVSATHKYLGEAVGQEFVRKHFSPESKKRVLEILKNISGALSDRIDTLIWMSPETKKQAQEKLATITPKIGYPDKWRDFSSLTITRDSYAANVMAARQFEYKRDLAKIGKPIDKTEWFSPPQEVNAYYNPLFNEIVFMAGILQPPFFDPNADDAINYGGIGAVIGHEIIHGFDDSGRQFDKEGNLKDWWTKSDETSFVERAGCIEKQFSAYEVEKGVNVNGQLVLGESIADLGGLNLAYNAFQKSLAGKPRPKDIDGFTPEQRFFLGWAQVWRANSRPEFLRLQVSTDEHPPAKFRINGPLSNMPAFAKAFGCQANQPMVRGEGCEIW